MPRRVAPFEGPYTHDANEAVMLVSDRWRCAWNEGGTAVPSIALEELDRERTMFFVIADNGPETFALEAKGVMETWSRTDSEYLPERA